MAKQLLFGEDARNKILAGAKIVNDAVGSTLGPKANNVAIERPYGSPSVIHDGVSVAKEIELEDAMENIGAQLIKEAAQKTNDNAGDGTTTATILTYAMAKEALKNIAAGANAMMIRKGMGLAVDDIVQALKSLSRQLKTDDEIKQVATISAQDETIGSLIFEAIKSSVVTVSLPWKSRKRWVSILNTSRVCSLTKAGCRRTSKLTPRQAKRY